MHYNEQLLNRLVVDRTRDLRREAAQARALTTLRIGWRSRLARALVALGERLEPERQPNRPVIRA